MRRFLRGLVVDFKGGLGNQLFQYAAARRVAAIMNTPFFASRASSSVIPSLSSFLNTEIPVATRRLDLCSYGTSETDSTAVRLLVRSIRRLWGKNRILTNAYSGCLPSPRSAVIRLSGYFQHPDFFEMEVGHIADRILSPRETVGIGDDYIAVHLRRGDFLNLGWALPLRYYQSAVQMMHTFLPLSTPVWVIGDDEMAVRGLEQALESMGLTLVPSNTRRENIDKRKHDFFSIASARAVIMSNSTFCWWAVRVGEHVDRGSSQIVVSPSVWTRNADSSVLTCPGWHALPWLAANRD